MPPKRGGFGAAPGSEQMIQGDVQRATLGQRQPQPSQQQQQQQRQQQQRHYGGGGGGGGGYQGAPPSRHADPAPRASQPAQRLFDAYVVLDFEATCEENTRLPDPEVIEFPFVVVDARTHSIATEFQRYVRPVRRARLSDFCTRLTGITQSTVDAAQPFPAVFREALRFLHDAGLGDAGSGLRSYCVVTCGDWDLGTMLPTQLRLTGDSGLRAPTAWTQWCNLKKHMQAAKMAPRGRRIDSMPAMLDAVGLPLQGHHHSGIDDCRNIAAVLCELLRRGHTVGPTNLPRGQPPQTWTATVPNLPSLDSIPPSLAAGTPPRPAAPAPAPAPAAAAAAGGGRPAAVRTDPSAVKNSATPLRPTLPPLVVSTSRPFSWATLQGDRNVAPLDDKRVRQVSRTLSTILRHQALNRRVPITANGFVSVAELLRTQLQQFTLAEVYAAVRDNDKQRFELGYSAADDAAAHPTLYIRAVQGHSMPEIELEMPAITAAEAAATTAIHGTTVEAWNKILECGYLSIMGRHHIHCAKGLPKENGVISGIRGNAHVLIYLNVPRMIADGVPLLKSSNGVLLTPGVGTTGRLPLQYVSKVLDRRTMAQMWPKH